MCLVLAMAAAAGMMARDASAQLGALLSPGRLSRPHASLEGIGHCLSCHAPGQGVSAVKCLSCHKPVADRIAQAKGVHRNVTTDCVACHVEHAGVDAELRPFDQRTFDHTADAAFPLDGLHAQLATKCDSCHRTRSFLSVTSACASCHVDVHKGSLGTRCSTCHATSVGFADTRATFDHGATAFPLTGAHTTVSCASCHDQQPGSYKVAQFASCATCHTDPHQERFGGSCSSCHATPSWQTTKVDHSRTAFALVGRHAEVACARCHTRPAMKAAPEAGTCGACHADPHRGSFQQDCRACHDENGWQTDVFDHSTTGFPLVDAHARLTCASCHTGGIGLDAGGRPDGAARDGGRSGAARGAAAGIAATNFRGLKSECAACHQDVHEGELGTRCESCHTARTFSVTSFVHSRRRPFFEGQHASLGCAQCHRLPAAMPSTRTPTAAAPLAALSTAAPRMPHLGLPTTPDTCASCHQDVHAGQVGTRCDGCHTLDAAAFAITAFPHERTRFPLSGPHAAVPCVACHKVETGSFPGGMATARRLTGFGQECASCHQDPHQGQLDRACERCHSSETFRIAAYTHLRADAQGSFFAGEHLAAPCAACHKGAPGGTGPPAPTAYRISTSCIDCHRDVHRGALGSRCETCHKP
jgi:hypothetical protein